MKTQLKEKAIAAAANLIYEILCEGKAYFDDADSPAEYTDEALARAVAVAAVFCFDEFDRIVSYMRRHATGNFQCVWTVGADYLERGGIAQFRKG